MSIADVIRTAADTFGDRVAVEDSDGLVTFTDLCDRVHRLAAGLGTLSVNLGSTVLVLLPNSVAAVEVDLALTISGHVRVALNPRVGEVDWARIMQDCNPAVVVFDPRIAGAADFAARSSAAVLISTVATAVAPHTLDDVAAAAPARRALPHLAPDSLCALHYSSGTSGIPKGAQRSHRNRLASMRAMREHVLAGTLDGPTIPVFVHAGPVIHTSGLFVLPFLECGGRQILLDHARPAEVAAAIGTYGGTHTALVPTVVARLLDLTDEQLAPMRRMRMLAYAGAPMPVEHLRQAYRRITPNLVQYYGMVEAIPPLTVLTPADHRRGMTEDPNILGSIGRPCADVDIEFREDHRICVDGQVGELVVSGPAVSQGYHNAASRTDLGKSHTDGCLYSGDLGYRAACGYIHLTGRSKDMIITGGYNVYPLEVEEALSAIPGVHDVVVVGLPDPVWGQRIVAAYTGDTANETAVLAESRRRLPDFKRPKSVHRVETLPLTPLGKVDRAHASLLLAGLTPF
ncbi:class I adenylate-forming enzyme family protein [Gordonia sp. ABSL11-1]|uniref:class I adenylate-forming enzyme family protein n=1 Tax=Gordonia sp. ABSL11-1 TaxID=3053924 RepID=UPI002574723B|nr:class I adenylate-forming enzyme family protein [Gordonia sp. ABSL11-1]MDL9948902.1 class I adenylate-forming enzyme family protein [Gordonia sp. ABSL11-1]